MPDQHIKVPLTQLGFVAIGRNEGERLESALTAITTMCPDSPVVYVDSGSDDNSVGFAQSLGIDVVELDMSVPFTAARARNAGFAQLYQSHPELRYVQFFDGDCTMVEGWVEAALTCLESQEDVVIASGRRSEKFPEHSVYNTLMDIEWNTPVGEIKAVLGDMCVDVNAFKAAEGFSENIIAAEDDDFCIRVRQKTGKKVMRVDANMSLHDANITKLSQWYKRAVRGGYGYANIHQLHGKGPEQYFKKELRSAIVWGGGVPSVFVFSLFFAPIFSLLILAGYNLFIARTAMRQVNQGREFKIALIYSALIFTAKVPEFYGACKYWKNRLLSRKHQLIEYK
jgi:GT2 family glycosyltransferase